MIYKNSIRWFVKWLRIIILWNIKHLWGLGSLDKKEKYKMLEMFESFRNNPPTRQRVIFKKRILHLLVFTWNVDFYILRSTYYKNIYQIFKILVCYFTENLYKICIHLYVIQTGKLDITAHSYWSSSCLYNLLFWHWCVLI